MSLDFKESVESQHLQSWDVRGAEVDFRCVKDVRIALVKIAHCIIVRTEIIGTMHCSQISMYTVPLKSKLPPLVSFLTRLKSHFSLETRLVSLENR